MTKRLALRRLTGAVVVSAALLPLSAAVLAQDADTEATEHLIEYRQKVMDTMSGLMGVLSGQLRHGLTAGPDLPAVATALAAMQRDLPGLFPPGSDFGETRALPKVWSDPADFAATATEAENAAKAFAAAVAGGDKAAIGLALRAVGEGCKGCHSDYRSDD